MSFSFEIVAEACANVPQNLRESENIHLLAMTNVIEGKEFVNNGVATPEETKDLYTRMRNKASVSTSCVSADVCDTIFRNLLNEGKDILYVGFSSALSASFSIADTAIENLKKEFPDRKLISVSSLAAACGHGLLIKYAADKRAEGKTIEETATWLEENKLKLCHLFTVEDLKYLYKGGRLKKSSYLIANTLNIKPVMHVDNEGRLVAVGKVFGRKMSLSNIANRLVDNIVDPENQTIYVNHADCKEDAEYLVAKIKEKITVKEFVIEDLDLVIGAHSGPGTIAIFFIGKQR